MSNPLSNVLLDALPEEARQRLLTQLRPVTIPIRTSLYEPGDQPKYIHFITSGIASIVVSMANGDTTEVGTVGREGLPQGLHLLGSASLPTRCFMQIGGTALRMELRQFERIFLADEAVRQVVLQYCQYHSLLLSQLAGCNRLHGVEARLARWLRMIQDRTGDSVLKLTQEFLGQMIGSRRTTVSAVAGALQARGLIVYSRGTVRILNPTGLENVACECYVVTRDLLGSLYNAASQKLWDEAEPPQEEDA
jgi:CRP-like cAMP-binding protein